MAVVSISLPDPLLESADALIARRGFAGRSEFVRACVRDFLVNAQEIDASGDAHATLTLVYPEGHEKEFSKLRHTFGDTVRTLIHGHAGTACLEVFVLEGDSRRIQEFADSVRGTRSALQVTLTFAHPVPQEPDAHPVKGPPGKPATRRHKPSHTA